MPKAGLASVAPLLRVGLALVVFSLGLAGLVMLIDPSANPPWAIFLAMGLWAGIALVVAAGITWLAGQVREGDDRPA